MGDGKDIGGPGQSEPRQYERRKTEALVADVNALEMEVGRLTARARELLDFRLNLSRPSAGPADPELVMSTEQEMKSVRLLLQGVIGSIEGSTRSGEPSVKSLAEGLRVEAVRHDELLAGALGIR